MVYSVDDILNPGWQVRVKAVFRYNTMAPKLIMSTDMVLSKALAAACAKAADHVAKGEAFWPASEEERIALVVQAMEHIEKFKEKMR